MEGVIKGRVHGGEHKGGHGGGHGGRHGDPPYVDPLAVQLFFLYFMLKSQRWGGVGGP